MHCWVADCPSAHLRIHRPRLGVTDIAGSVRPEWSDRRLNLRLHGREQVTRRKKRGRCRSATQDLLWVRFSDVQEQRTNSAQLAHRDCVECVRIVWEELESSLKTRPKIIGYSHQLSAQARLGRKLRPKSFSKLRVTRVAFHNSETVGRV